MRSVETCDLGLFRSGSLTSTLREDNCHKDIRYIRVTAEDSPVPLLKLRHWVTNSIHTGQVSATLFTLTISTPTKVKRECHIFVVMIDGTLCIEYVPEPIYEIGSTVQDILAVVRLENPGIVQFLYTLFTTAQEAQMEQQYSAMMACCKQSAMCGIISG